MTLLAFNCSIISGSGLRSDLPRRMYLRGSFQRFTATARYVFEVWSAATRFG